MTNAIVVRATTEEGRLLELESYVKRGINWQHKAGLALWTISEEKLYQARGFDTFEQYLADTWPDLKRRRAYQLIQMSTVNTNVALGHKKGTKIPKLSERQTRVIAALPPKDQRAVVETAANSGKITSERLEYLKSKLLEGRTDLQQMTVAENDAARIRKREKEVLAEAAADKREERRQAGIKAIEKAIGIFEELNYPYCLDCLRDALTWAECAE